MENDLEILCIYQSDDGRQVYYNTLVKKMDSMEMEDYEPEKFWQTFGGISISVNGYCTILQSTGFYNMVKITNFLLQSLFIIKGKISNRFDINETNPNSVILETTNNEVLKFEKFQKQVELSFQPFTVKSFRDRGDRYFDNVLFKSEDWFNAAYLALDEYFQILFEVASINSKNPFTKNLMSYYHTWKSI